MSNVEYNNENINENDIRKEEILARSRDEKRDEGEEHASLKAKKTGQIFCFYITALVLLVISLAIGQISAVWVMLALFAAFESGYELTKYRLTKKVSHMVGFLTCIAAVLFSIFAFVDYSLEWHNIHEFTKAIRWW